LDVANNRMVYATDSAWNGELVTNIKATVFDRRGYVVFPIVPLGTTLTDLEIREMVDATLTSYVPVPDDTHASFVSDDKVAVAAAAAIGVLATLVKVKFGKAAVGGLLAAALLFLKKRVRSRCWCRWSGWCASCAARNPKPASEPQTKDPGFCPRVLIVSAKIAGQLVTM